MRYLVAETPAMIPESLTDLNIMKVAAEAYAPVEAVKILPNGLSNEVVDTNTEWMRQEPVVRKLGRSMIDYAHGGADVIFYGDQASFLLKAVGHYIANGEDPAYRDGAVDLINESVILVGSEVLAEQPMIARR